MPSDFAKAVAASIEIARFVPVKRSNSAWSGRAMPIAVALEEDEALQVDLLDADVVGDAHEVGQLRDRLLQARSATATRAAWRRPSRACISVKARTLRTMRLK